MFHLDKKMEEGDCLQKDQKITMIITEIKETKGGRKKPSSVIPFKSTLIQKSKTFLEANTCSDAGKWYEMNSWL